jgi:hypothetical protein
MAVDPAAEQRRIRPPRLDERVREPRQSARPAADSQMLETSIAFEHHARVAAAVDRGATAAEPAHDHPGGHRDRTEVGAVAELHDVAGTGIAQQGRQRDRLARLRLEQLDRPFDGGERESVDRHVVDPASACSTFERRSSAVDVDAVVELTEPDR